MLGATAGADGADRGDAGAAEPDGTKLLDAVPALFAAAERHGLRIAVVGGAGSLRVAGGGPRLIDTPEFPDEFKPEAGAHAEVLAALQEASAGVDWFYVSPAANFGAHAQGGRTGAYRLGRDVLVTDARTATPRPAARTTRSRSSTSWSGPRTGGSASRSAAEQPEAGDATHRRPVPKYLKNQ
ncbi:NAD(P)-dependent oxidoreductase [Saccharopolyspora sp. NPDC000995]